jgi:hypothetical protein
MVKVLSRNPAQFGIGKLNDLIDGGLVPCAPGLEKLRNLLRRRLGHKNPPNVERLYQRHAASWD